MRRDVLPLPLVLLLKFTVSLKLPCVKLAAPLLTETDTAVLAPGAKVPLLGERVVQPCVFDAVQLIVDPPEF